MDIAEWPMLLSLLKRVVLELLPYATFYDIAEQSLTFLKQFTKVHFNYHAFVISKGEVLRDLYIIQNGELRELVDGVHQSTLHRGDIVGEHETLVNQAPIDVTYQVSSSKGATLYILSYDHLKTLVESMAGRHSMSIHGLQASIERNIQRLSEENITFLPQKHRQTTSPVRLQEEPICAAEQRDRHVFIDFTNLYHGALICEAKGLPRITLRDQRVIFSAENLWNALGKGKPGKRVVVGSAVDGLSPAVEQGLRTVGFKVLTFDKRVSDGYTLRNLLQPIDDMLRKESATGATIVLVTVTGDIISSQGIETVSDYLVMGLNVEIYSWSHSIAEAFRSLQERFSANRLKVVHLNSIISIEPSGGNLDFTMLAETQSGIPQEKPPLAVFPSPLRAPASLPTFIFVNNYRFYSCTMDVFGSPFHIHLFPFVQRIEADTGPVVFRIVKGNVPDSNHPFWETYKSLRYIHDYSSEKSISSYNIALDALLEKPEPIMLVLVIGGAASAQELRVVYGVLARGGSVTLWVWRRFLDADTDAHPLVVRFRGLLQFQYFEDHTDMLSPLRAPLGAGEVQSDPSPTTASATVAINPLPIVQPQVNPLGKLFEACKADDIAEVGRLIDAGVDVRQCVEGRFSNKTALHLSARRNRVEIVRLLLSKGADINARDKDKWTPLKDAASGNSKEVVAILLEHGADPNAQDKDGWTPLMNGVGNKSKEVIELLLTKGADANIRNEEGVTAIDLAVQSGALEIVSFLRSYLAMQKLFQACIDDDIASARELIESGVDVNLHSLSFSSKTALHIAAHYNRVEIARLLLLKGADVNARDKNGLTPLELAKNSNLKEIVDLLQNHVAVPTFPTYVFVNNYRVYTSATNVLECPVHIHVFPFVQKIEASTGPVVSRLIKGNVPDVKHPYWDAFKSLRYLHDPSSEKRSSAYTTALMALREKREPVLMVLVIGGAADSQELQVMSSVLARGGSVALWMWKRFVDPESDTYALAAQYNGRVCFYYFDDHTDMMSRSRRIQDASNDNAMDDESVPSRSTDASTVSRVNHHPPAAQLPPNASEILFAACIKDNLGVVRKLIDAGIDVNQHSGERFSNKTALHLAARRNRVEIARLLLSKGADVTALDQDGWTPLKDAARDNSKEVIELLLEHGADPNAQDHKDGWTPLMSAVSSKAKETVELFLSKGADANIRNKEGATALDLAVRSSALEMATLLQSHSNRVEVANALLPNGVAKLLLALGPDADDKDKDGWTPMVKAVSEVAKEVVELLLIKGNADKNSRNKEGATALDVALQSGAHEIAAFLQSRRVCDQLFDACCNGDIASARELIESGVDVNLHSATYSEQTALHLAAHHNRVEIARLLLLKKANVNARDKDGSTPLHLAARYNRLEVATILLQSSADMNALDKDGLTPLEVAMEAHSKATQDLLQRQCAASIPTFVFVSNYRVYTSSTEVLKSRVHVHLFPFVQSIEAGAGFVVSRLVKGNVPIVGHPYWRALESCGYVHDPSPEKTVSQYNTALQSLLDNHEPILLVLVIGGTTTPQERDVIRRILARGGSVSLWLWKRFVDSNADILALQAVFKGQLRLQYFDDFPDMVSERLQSKDLAPAESSAEPDPFYESGLELKMKFKGGQDDFSEVTSNDVNEQMSGRRHKRKTALHFAARGNFVDLVTLLLREGANPNIRDEDGCTPLKDAVWGNAKEVSSLLLSHKADPNIQDLDGVTPLLSAVSSKFEELVQLLLEYGADADIADAEGMTPLISAIHLASERMVELLLDHGADPDTPDEDGMSPLMVAVNNNSKGIVQLLLSRDADLFATDEDGDNALDIAVECKYDDIVKILRAADLLSAVEVNDMNAVQNLLDGGAEVDQQRRDYFNGRTALHVAARKGLFDMAKLLLDEGADPNILDESNGTTLMDAVCGNSEAVAELLLSAEVDVDAQDTNGWTALMHAVNNYSIELVMLLLKHEADPTIQDEDGWTAHKYATNNNYPEMDQLLSGHGGVNSAKDSAS